MKTKTIFVSVLILFIALIACASYKPTPAPVPMKTFEAYTGEEVHGFFNIEKASGPEGMTLIIEPNVLKITSRVMTPIAGFPNARRYTFYFDYIFGDTSQNVIIKSYDKRKHEVINSIVFNLLEDEPQVFTECGEITTEPNEPVVQKNDLVTWPIYYTDDKVYYSQMWTEEGKNGVQRRTYSVAK